VLSILIGVNDCSEVFRCEDGSRPERYKKIYRYLLDEALEQNPELLIVIMEPFFGISKEEAHNDYMSAHVGEYAKAAKEIAEEYGAVFVPLQDVFDDYAKRTDIFKLLWDGVHPTTGGHQLIARRWKECVEERLNNR
ncbi:MAG: lysophospholipase, partial [Clostridia bacterium]|nr:lysophospholipase [Clostridia bacterium]